MHGQCEVFRERIASEVSPENRVTDGLSSNANETDGHGFNVSNPPFPLSGQILWQFRPDPTLM